MPNRCVDVNSRQRSACYPRRTFCPLSDGNSTLNHRITWACFRTCSTCKSRSQAPFYHYALCMIADHAEGTFELLRYNLGGNRPSQTDPLTLSPTRFHGTRLDFRLNKTGISLLAPPCLTTGLRSLPAMLHMLNQKPISEYSKGARGLSVLLRVSGIFTGITTSPRSTLRQCSTRYTIRAGRNLPDKEFRYLRTVIVTADIHQGFDSELAPLLLTFWHWSRVTPYTSSYRVCRVLCFC